MGDAGYLAAGSRWSLIADRCVEQEADDRARQVTAVVERGLGKDASVWTYGVRMAGKERDGHRRVQPTTRYWLTDRGLDEFRYLWFTMLIAPIISS